MSKQPKSIDALFNEYVDIANAMPTQTADNMLIAYGFYKQATVGDNHEQRPSESSNVVQTLKHDAWKRLMGMTQEVAKQKYVEHVKAMIDISRKEGRL